MNLQKQQEDHMSDYIFFMIIGYLSGSILYAYIIPKFFCGIDIRQISKDKNPGTFNAFSCAGIKVGIFVLLLELAKGFLPVFLAARFVSYRSSLFCLIMAAPVIGHAFPFLHPRQGGKAIAVSFGCLMGLYPFLTPLLYLIVFYLLFSVIIIIEPHLFRSIITFFCFTVSCIRTLPVRSFIYGSILISATVVLRHLLRYKKERLQIRFLPYFR